jgi:hypothetical protein
MSLGYQGWCRELVVEFPPLPSRAGSVLGQQNWVPSQVAGQPSKKERKKKKKKKKKNSSGSEI